MIYTYLHTLSLHDALPISIDQASPAAKGPLMENWFELDEGLARPTDLRITKHQWGAFYGTDLDLQLRRRRIETVVIGGIATNFGVESTARAAHDHGYAPVLVEDRSEEHTSELQSLMRISYAVFCLKKKKKNESKKHTDMNDIRYEHNQTKHTIY